MSGLFGHLVGVMIVILMVTFIGIWVWAWRPKHRRTFGALAQIPMQDGGATGMDGDCTGTEGGEGAPRAGREATS